jgi:hypothetical protein
MAAVQTQQNNLEWRNIYRTLILISVMEKL